MTPAEFFIDIISNNLQQKTYMLDNIEMIFILCSCSSNSKLIIKNILIKKLILCEMMLLITCAGNYFSNIYKQVKFIIIIINLPFSEFNIQENKNKIYKTNILLNSAFH